MSDGRSNYSISIDNTQLRAGAEESKNILRGISKTAVKEGDAIDNTMRNIGRFVAGAFAVQQLKEFGTQVVKVRGEFQQMEVAFRTMLGSAEKADALLAQLTKTAMITPFGMSDIAQASKQLLAYGVEADKVNETLIRLGDIAAGLSIPIGDLAYLYGTTMTQGTLFTQDLRQFMGRGIPLADELAKQFGVAKDKVGELVTAGKVGFPEVQKAIWAMTNEGSKFGGLMEEQSKTITGQISNIEDAIEQMFNELGKKSEGFISSTLNVASSVVENWEKIGKALLVVISTYGAYKAAVIAVAAAHKLVAIWGEVQAFLSLTKSVTSAKDAMLLLNMATKANPIGLILGVVAAAAATFGLFAKNTSAAAEMTTKFGEKASTAITRINTLTTTLKGLSTGSSTHKKVMDELNGILEEYGIQALKEGDSIDVVNKKRAQAIELIKQEAIERQRANALNQGAQDYAAKLAEAQKTLYSDLSGAMTNGILLLSDNEEIQQNSSAISTIIGNVIEQNITDIAGKTGDEYQKGLDKIFKTIQDRMRAIGISEETISKEWATDDLFNHQNIISKYIKTVQQAKEEHNRYTDAVNKSADAEKAAADGANTFEEKVAATQRSLQGTTDDVHKLYTNIKNLMSKYNENTIGFTVTFNAEPPKWMNDKSIPELQRLAKVFTSLGENTPAGGTTLVNGKEWTKQELLQRGADYAQAAENKQTATDDAKRKAEQEKKEREKKAKEQAAAAERAKKEKQQIADETAERNRQIDEYTTSVVEQTRQSELEIRQERINMMKDGFDKEMAQNALNYDRLKAENDKRANQMLNDLKDKKVLEWKNENPKATKEQEIEYRKSLTLTVSDLTAEQRAQIKAYADVAEEIRQHANKDSLDKMLSDVLTYEQQRTKIADEYEKKRKTLYETDDKGNYILDNNGNKKLKQGVTQGNVDEVNRQETEAYNSIDEQFAQREETYKAWCNEIANYTLSQLEAVLADAQDKLKEAEKNGASSKDIAVARAKVTTAQNKVNTAKATNDVSPKKRSIKEWEDLYKTLNECEKEFESIGDTVGGVAGEIISTAGLIMSSSLQMINGIVQLVNMSTTGIQGTATAAATAISTVEKASVILTIISAALQIAMQIVNLFNNDEEKQKEIEALQGRIDQLQWELDHQDILRLQQNSFNALVKVRQVMYDIRQEMIAQANATGSWMLRMVASSRKISSSQALLKKGAEEIARAYANISYTADKALGAEKYNNANEQLQNIAKQQIMLQEQINAENSKKKTDHGAIQDWENKIQELGEQAVSIINDMVEDIMGGSSTEIAEQLSDAFFEAFQNGEDAAEAWGNKVNEIVADVLKRMLVSKFLEEPLGDIFNKYKAKWFKDGQFVGLDAVINSMSGFANDLNAVGDDFQKIWETLPDSIKNMFTVTEEATREAQEKGIATASQESVDELNGRATAIQGHTYSISENTKLLVMNTGLILQSVLNIEKNTDDIAECVSSVDSNLKTVKDTVNDIALKGTKIRT